MKSGYKYVKIPKEIFFKIGRFLITREEDLCEEILGYYEKKLNKMQDHKLFSTFKTSDDEEEVETARNEYLDRKGIPEDFRY